MREIIGGLDDKTYGLSPMVCEFQIYEVIDSMTKRELVQSLPKVKLVLGNGFDLHCGLHTRYSDYFNSSSEKYRKIIDWVKHFGNVKRYLFEESSNDDFWYELKDFEKYNFWDVLFCLQSYEDDKNKKVLTCTCVLLFYFCSIIFKPS